MASQSGESSRNHVEIWASGISAAIDPYGAQLMSLRSADGSELLWQGDPAIWPDRAPILFPVIGPVTNGEIRHGGHRFPMPAHGFAQSREFEVQGHMRNRAVLELRADQQTRQHYPFDFVLGVAFDLTPSALVTTISVTNEGSEAMPADVGFHPGFNRPLIAEHAGMDYGIVFAEQEPAPIRRGVDDPIFLTTAEHPTPVVDRVLRLRDALFEDNAIVFDRINSHSLTYGPLERGNGPHLRVAYPDSPYLAVWSRPGARFTAIEPWQGLPSPVGFDGELIDKPGIAVLQPGESRSWRLHLAIIDSREDS